MVVSDCLLQVLILKIWVLFKQILLDFSCRFILGRFEKNHLIWNDSKLTNHKSLVFCSWEPFNDPVFALFFEISDFFLYNLVYDIIVNCKNNAYQNFEKYLPNALALKASSIFLPCSVCFQTSFCNRVPVSIMLILKVSLRVLQYPFLPDPVGPSRNTRFTLKFKSC